MTALVSEIPPVPVTASVVGPASWPARMLRHAFVIPSIVIVMGVCVWFATWGDGRLFYPEHFCGFYDAQARALLHGRLDVPQDAIGFEAFIRDGKTYGYFGIAPALLRLPLVILFPAMDGRWSRLLLLSATFINLICAYRLVLKLGVLPEKATAGQKAMISLFILCAGIGSTEVLIVSRCYTYHEAILWGATFALLFTDRLLAYLARPSLQLLAAMGFFAFMSFHSRATGGAGTLLALCVLAMVLLYRAARRRSATSDAESECCRQVSISATRSTVSSALGGSRQNAGCVGGAQSPAAHLLSKASPIGLAAVDRPACHAIVALAIICLTATVYFAVNFGKFHTFEGVPVRLYGMYINNPIRMRITGGKQFHLENIPTTAVSVFCSAGMRLTRQFPWIYMLERARLVGSPAIDVVEPYSSIPVCMCGLFLLVIAGVKPLIRGTAGELRRMRLPVLALLIGGAVVLATVGITQRYLHDFYPFLIVAAAAGMGRHLSAPNVAWRARLFVAPAVASILLNCLFALEFQREVVWGVARAKQQEWTHIRLAVDRMFHHAALATAEK